MKKFLPIIIILVVLAVGGAGAYYLLGGGSGEFVGSLTEAFSRAVPLKCTFEGEGTSEVAYVNGADRVYGEFTDADGTGYFLLVDNCYYVWEKGSAEGFKGCTAPAEGKESVGFFDVTEEADVSLEEDVDYRCVPTTVSASTFAPPSDVQFLDFSETLEGGF